MDKTDLAVAAIAEAFEIVGLPTLGRIYVRAIGRIKAGGNGDDVDEALAAMRCLNCRIALLASGDIPACLKNEPMTCQRGFAKEAP